jgi:hypothetical protein
LTLNRGWLLWKWSPRRIGEGDDAGTHPVLAYGVDTEVIAKNGYGRLGAGLPVVSYLPCPKLAEIMPQAPPTLSALRAAFDRLNSAIDSCCEEQLLAT